MNREELKAEAKAKLDAWRRNSGGCREKFTNFGAYWSGSSANIGFYNGPPPSYDRILHEQQFSGLPVEDQAREEWRRDRARLQAEGFSGEAAFIAFRKAEAAGLVKIQGRG